MATTRFPELTDKDIMAARRRGMEADVGEAHAVAVRYDRASESLVLTLRGGLMLLVPTHLLQDVAGAAPELIEKVELTPRGSALHWEELDADFSVQGLVAGSFGNAPWMRSLQSLGLLDPASNRRLDTLELLRGTAAAAMGRRGGQARSPRKTAAVRANGLKGGRPRKTVPA